jgi:hypothetical protein
MGQVLEVAAGRKDAARQNSNVSRPSRMRDDRIHQRARKRTMTHKQLL